MNISLAIVWTISHLFSEKWLNTGSSGSFFEVDVFYGAPASVLDLESDWAETPDFYAHLLIFMCVFCEPRWTEILPSLVHTHAQKHTIGDTHLSLEMVPFITALEIAYSCLADKCFDLDRYGIVRGRVANKCEGRLLSLPLYLFSFLSSVLPRGEAKLCCLIVPSPTHKGWCDCWAFQWAKRQELYLTIHFSTSSHSPCLSFLGRYSKSLLAPVCVEGKAAFVSAPLSAVSVSSVPHKPPFTVRLLVSFQKKKTSVAWNNIVKAWNPNQQKPTPCICKTV